MLGLKKNKREEMAKKLLTQDRVSIINILTTSFGEWPPKGLDIMPELTHARKATFAGFFEANKEDRKNKNIITKPRMA